MGALVDGILGWPDVRQMQAPGPASPRKLSGDEDRPLCVCRPVPSVLGSGSFFALARLRPTRRHMSMPV
jgi:hypothetical protein